MDGIINLLKPPGMTSFDAVAIMRRLTGTRKIGHTGTLDPDAAGVLPICIGKATKAVEYLTDKEKTYRVEMILGIETDTQDSSGQVIREVVPQVDHDAIRDACLFFVGPIFQIPPMHSAVKIGGKRLYDLARSGQIVERAARPVTIHTLDILQTSIQEKTIVVRMDVRCSKGTYIRTLCHDIGQRLGCGAHMSFLLRTTSGPFRLSDAVCLETLAKAAELGEIEKYLLPLDTAFLQMPQMDFDMSSMFALENGQIISVPSLKHTNDLFRVYVNHVFLGLGHSVSAGSFKMVKWMYIDRLHENLRREDTTWS